MIRAPNKMVFKCISELHHLMRTYRIEITCYFSTNSKFQEQLRALRLEREREREVCSLVFPFNNIYGRKESLEVHIVERQLYGN